MPGTLLHAGYVDYVETHGMSPSRKLAPYLYAIEYMTYSEPSDVDMGGEGAGGCSSVHMSGVIGRNFDWYYDNRATFVIRCSKPGQHRSIGVASCDHFSETVASAGVYDPEYRGLPWFTLDGVNDAGVYASNNVVPNDTGHAITDAEPSGVCLAEIDARQLVRYILDKYGSAAEAFDDLREHVRITANKSLEKIGYCLHTMVADTTGECFVMEIVDGELVRIDSDISTNFWLSGTVCEQTRNARVYTNADAPEHLATRDSGISPKGSGLERWNTLVDGIASGADARQLMDSIRYTNAYRRDVEPVWCSEFVGHYGDGIVVTVDTPRDSELMTAILEISKSLYDNRVRGDHQTWQTVHSSVYDLRSKTLSLVSQEDSSHPFSFGL